jgi:hypothetical protein
MPFDASHLAYAQLLALPATPSAASIRQTLNIPRATVETFVSAETGASVTAIFVDADNKLTFLFRGGERIEDHFPTEAHSVLRGLPACLQMKPQLAQFAREEVEMHAGFATAYQDLAAFVETHIASRTTATKIVCTGYSTGGALASIGAVHAAVLARVNVDQSSFILANADLDRAIRTAHAVEGYTKALKTFNKEAGMQRPASYFFVDALFSAVSVSLITFGAPKAGDREFVDLVRAATHGDDVAYEVQDDPVTWLPSHFLKFREHYASPHGIVTLVSTAFNQSLDAAALVAAMERKVDETAAAAGTALDVSVDAGRAAVVESVAAASAAASAAAAAAAAPPGTTVTVTTTTPEATAAPADPAATTSGSAFRTFINTLFKRTVSDTVTQSAAVTQVGWAARKVYALRAYSRVGSYKVSPRHVGIHALDVYASAFAAHASALAAAPAKTAPKTTAATESKPLLSA